MSLDCLWLWIFSWTELQERGADNEGYESKEDSMYMEYGSQILQDTDHLEQFEKCSRFAVAKAIAKTFPDCQGRLDRCLQALPCLDLWSSQEFKTLAIENKKQTLMLECTPISEEILITEMKETRNSNFYILTYPFMTTEPKGAKNCVLIKKLIKYGSKEFNYALCESFTKV